MLTAAANDVRVFLGRARRLDPQALVRLRSVADGIVELWTVLPFDILAATRVPGQLEEDTTVRSGDLESALPDGPLPTPVNEMWRGALPGGDGEVLETIAASEFARLGESAAAALDAARGRGVGDRRLRDTLLDHIALQVTGDDGPSHDIKLRLVIGLLRMGFAPSGTVNVRSNVGRIGLQGAYGTVWNPSAGLSIL